MSDANEAAFEEVVAGDGAGYREDEADRSFEMRDWPAGVRHDPKKLLPAVEAVGNAADDVANEIDGAAAGMLW